MHTPVIQSVTLPELQLRFRPTAMQGVWNIMKSTERDRLVIVPEAKPPARSRGRALVRGLKAF